jgi:hypothetical protein
MFTFLVIAWSMHPDLISNEVGCAIPEPAQPSVGETPLFLRASEIIHSKCDMLQFCALVQVLEVHDFTSSADSDDDSPLRSNSSDSRGDGLLDANPRGTSLQPWPCVYLFVGE